MSKNQEDIVYSPIQQQAFEGASVEYKNSRKGIINGNPDDLAANEISNLQLRSQDIIRNNGYGKIALNNYVRNQGTISVSWKYKDSEGRVHSHKLMQELWDEFCADPNYDGFGNLANTQSLWHTEEFINGAAFTRLIIKKSSNRIPLKLQVIPATMQDLYYRDLSKHIASGIKFSGGKPSTYYFKPRDFKRLQGEIDPVIHNILPISVSADKITHQFSRTSAGQWVGIPMLSPVLIPLYEIDELIEATVAKQKAAQAIAWIVENSGITASATGSPSVISNTEGKEKVVFKASGGSTQYLNRGEKIHFYQSTDIGENLPVLIQSELRRIALSCKVPYHSLTGDLSGIDFSSLRAIGVELRSSIENIHLLSTIPLSLSPIAMKAKSLAELQYDVGDAYPTFRLPMWRGYDDLKDIQADSLEVHSGLGAIQKILSERDLTMEDILESVENIKQIEEALGRPLAGVNTSQQKNTNANTNSTSN